MMYLPVKAPTFDLNVSDKVVGAHGCVRHVPGVGKQWWWSTWCNRYHVHTQDHEVVGPCCVRFGGQQDIFVPASDIPYFRRARIDAALAIPQHMSTLPLVQELIRPFTSGEMQKYGLHIRTE